MRQVTPLTQFRDDMDRLFRELWTGSALAGRTGLGWRARQFPAVNVWETPSEFWAEAEVPGLKQDDLEIAVVGNEVTLRGERKPVEFESSVYHRQERASGSFVRTFRLPVEIESDKVEATLKDGVLTLRLPKTPAAQPRKIEVKSS